jgi:hypothetical protein
LQFQGSGFEQVRIARINQQALGGLRALKQ